MDKIKVNGRVYVAKELDFNFICDLQEAGIGLEEIQKKVLPATRVYVAYCMGVDAETAGIEINSHIINGGNLTDFINVFTDKAETSDFFRAIGQETEETAPKKTTKKKSEEAVTE